jgi:hypothetical protein
MIRANIEVESLTVVDAVRKKLMQLGPALTAGTVKLRGDSLFDDITAARKFMDRNAAETLKVKELIDEAKRRAKLKKVPPKGQI